jgi:acyl-[acyl-carrier-protein]-phospholipid O-acyltransferase/long-chain-fatty-acid--[acyl-carrier-protein] ligase
MRYLGSGAEKLSEEVRRTYLERFGVRIMEGYGATECAPVLALNTPLGYKVGTVGELMPEMEYRIEQVAGIEEGGVLHVRGPNVMLGYLRDDQPGVIQPPSSIFGEGWYNTGDVVSVDFNGAVTILGRRKRFAKVAGEMVSLDLPERIAVAASKQHQHAAVARVEAGRGEIIVLFTQDPGLRREQLLATAREMGAPDLAVPRRIKYMPHLPLLGNGKTDYVTLVKLSEELGKAEAVTTP